MNLEKAQAYFSRPPYSWSKETVEANFRTLKDAGSLYAGKPFDPHEHDAVAHEADEDSDGDPPVVSEVLRTGYRWKGKVLRPAMVKVRG